MRLGFVRTTIHRLAGCEIRPENGGDRVTINELGLKYGTDKSSSFHDYLRIYERYLEPMRETAKKVLEIGVAGGASIRMWRDYFPNATIYGIDHNVEFVTAIQSVGKPKEERIELFANEATDPVTWQMLGQNWCNNFDLIVDDGGHFSSQIIPAWNGAWPLLRHGGIYICEDMHAIWANEKGRTAFDFFEEISYVQLHENGQAQCGKRFSGEFEFVHWYKSLVIIKKR